MARWLLDRPIFGAAFRPMFLLAGLAAALLVPVSVLVYPGTAGPWGAPASLWHAHELLFGYFAAVFAGFLLTAGPRWTGQGPPGPGKLAGLAALWLLGRLGMALPAAPIAAVALVDIAFLVLVAAQLAVWVQRSRNFRNYWAVAVLAVLVVANLAMHGGAWADAWALLEAGAWTALGGLGAFIALIGGRVVPAFTRNAVPQAAPRSRARVERLAVPLSLAVAAALALQPWLGGGPAPFLAAAGGLAAVVHGVRLAGWGGWQTRHEPLLWGLHLGYAWLVLAYALLAVAGLGWLPLDSALHALGAGAGGTMSLAMLARVPLGHTGRALRAPAMLAPALALVGLGALLRVLVLAVPALTATLQPALALAGGLWSLAFALYVLRYTPILVGPARD